MGKICKFCGMESERDQVCTWCGKSLAPEGAAPAPEETAPAEEALPVAEPVEPAGAPTKGAAPGKSGKRSARGAPEPGRYAGAARAMFEAEAAKQQAPVWKWYALTGGILLAVILLTQIATYLLALRTPSAPGEWQSYSSRNHLLTMQAPVSWKFSTSGSLGTFESVRFRAGNLYRVEVNGSMVAGTLSDVFGATARMAAGLGGASEGEVPLAKRREGQLHTFLGARAEKEDPSYKEVGAMAPMTVGLYPAACSDYTTTKTVGLVPVEMKGRRITIPAGDLAYEIRLECPAAHWAEFEPVAMKIVGSTVIGPGR